MFSPCRSGSITEGREWTAFALGSEVTFLWLAYKHHYLWCLTFPNTGISMPRPTIGTYLAQITSAYYLNLTWTAFISLLCCSGLNLLPCVSERWRRWGLVGDPTGQKGLKLSLEGKWEQVQIKLPVLCDKQHVRYPYPLFRSCQTINHLQNLVIPSPYFKVF